MALGTSVKLDIMHNGNRGSPRCRQLSGDAPTWKPEIWDHPPARPREDRVDRPALAPAIVTPLYTSSLLGYTAYQSGVLLVMRAAPVVVLTPIFATLAQRGADIRYMLAGGFALSAGSLWWLHGMMTTDTTFAQLAWPLLFSGIGQSMLLARRLVEAGVRLVTITWLYVTPSGKVANVWDNHGGTPALGGLTDRHRSVIRLRVWERTSFAQIGTALGVSEDAARMLYGRALAKLRASMRSGDDSR